MQLTYEERQIVKDADRLACRSILRPFVAVAYIGVVAMFCAGVIGLWQRGNPLQYLLLLGFACSFYGNLQLKNRLRVALRTISKLRAEYS